MRLDFNQDWHYHIIAVLLGACLGLSFGWTHDRTVHNHKQICGYRYTLWIPSGNVEWHTNTLFMNGQGQVTFKNASSGWVTFGGSWEMYDYGGTWIQGCKL
jgi:hypothetical protein